MKNQQYVLGFLFSPDKTKVALIRKNRPEWQAGFLNGIGGHVESGEDPHSTMNREFKEEATGVDQNVVWTDFAEMRGEDWEVRCFFGQADISNIKALTDEKIVVKKVGDFSETIENLPWLIYMALDAMDKRPYFATINYDQNIFDKSKPRTSDSYVIESDLDMDQDIEYVLDVMLAIKAMYPKPPKKMETGYHNCPKCGGKIYYRIYENMHVHGNCETSGCLSWME